MTLPPLTGAQQKAVEKLRENLALQSGAGCGKTRVLAERFSSLLLAGADREDLLSRLVAVTFTDKAALEMTQRVRAMLRAFAASAGSDADRRKLLDWLQQAHEARISTIHGFCASILRSWAVEAGLDPDFAVAGASIVTDRLLAEAVEATVLAAVERDDPGVLALFAGDWLSVDRLLPLLRDLVAERGRVDFAAYRDPQATLQRWRETLARQAEQARQDMLADATVRETLDALGNFACSSPEDKLLPLYEHARGLAGSILDRPLDASAGAMDELLGLKLGNAGAKSHWSGGTPKDVRDAIKALQEALRPYGEYACRIGPADERSAEELAGLAGLAADAEARYRQAKLQAGLVDFTDLLTRTRELLADKPGLRKALSRGIDQILIDEAQDTDAVQLELLLGLLDPGADGLPRPGRLFLVGDAKQSIYRFRGAQLEVFTGLCEKLGRAQQIHLAESFRTHAAGVAFVNRVFGSLLGESYTRIVSKRPTVPSGPTVELLLAGGSDALPIDTAEAAQAAQAVLTAQRIAEMIDRGERRVWDGEAGVFRAVRPGDVAILFTRMTHSLEYERQLQLRGLPYYVVGGTGFYRQQEVFDLLNALRAIDNPCDDIAAMGVLRSALVGLDDNALMHLSRAGQRPYLTGLDADRLGGVLDDSSLGALRRALGWLRRLGVRKDAMGIDALIGALLEETGYEAMLLARPGGRRRVGNVRMLRDRAREADGQMSLSEFLRLIDEEVLGEARDEQAAVAGEAEDVVRLMTVHKAKGLEFPVVFVPDLNIATQPVRDRLVLRRDWGMVANFTEVDEDREKPASYRVARARETSEQVQEALRKYYVALTRHEDHLVLLGANQRSEKTGRFHSAGSFLDRLDGVLGIGEAVDRGAERIDYGGGFEAELSIRPPELPQRRRAKPTTGQAMLDEADGPDDVAAGLARRLAAAGGFGLLGELPETATELELATTALTEFEHCPALYRWRQELRGPTFWGGTSAGVSDEASADRLDPLRLGSLLHRCWELMDFSAPQPSEELLDRSLRDLGLVCSEQARAAAMDELHNAMRAFAGSGLAAVLARSEQTRRELSFLLQADGTRLRGQVDLLARVDGQWRVVDYKSDRVSGPADVEAKAERYGLQVLTYAMAVERLTGEAPAGAELYFLRTGEAAPIDVSAGAIERARQRIAELAEALRQARRTGQWDACGRGECEYCAEIAARLEVAED